MKNQVIEAFCFVGSISVVVFGICFCFTQMRGCGDEMSEQSAYDRGFKAAESILIGNGIRPKEQP